nr:hypothetical protein [Mycoplasmopsis bovis]
MELSKTRVIQKWKFTNRVYKLLSLIIATKVKNNLIRLNLHQNYSLDR